MLFGQCPFFKNDVVVYMVNVRKKNGDQDPGPYIVPTHSVPPACSTTSRFSDGSGDVDTLLAELSGRVLNASLLQLNREIEKGLQQVHALFGCDWVILWEISENGEQVHPTNSFVAAGNALPENVLQHETLPFLISRIVDRQDIFLSGLQEMPEGAHIDRTWLMQCGIRSCAVIPLIVGDQPRGALSLACVTNERSWSDADIANIRRFSQVFGGALTRLRAYQLLQRRIQFETLITDLSAQLITASADDIDMHIKDALARVLKFFRGDRCVLAGVCAKTRVCSISYECHTENLEPVSGEINLAELFPWSYERLVVQGKHKNYSSMKQLPPEAEIELESWTAMGIRSALSVPIFVEGRVASLIAINTVHKEQFWPEEYVSRLRLLGEICIGGLARRESDKALREGKLRLQEKLREIEQLKQKIEKENLYLREETTLLSEHNEIIAESRKMKTVLLNVEQVARTDSTVLISGETGTGKELVARHIHKLSGRKGQPMVTVNCASLQPTLIESELFGREKGAYTGAMTKMTGRFEVADGSTIFLDEIGELPFDLQSKLLRVLEEGTFERLGSTRTIHVDVRVIAATNRNLLEDVQRGTFRRDLFYRLNVFPITIPPLRDHLEDLAPLVWTFVHQFEKKMGRQIENIAQRSMDNLRCHTWPGNIRELRNVIEHAMIISRERTLKVSLPAVAPTMDASENGVLELETAEREHILKVLHTCNWRMSGHGGAAEILGLKRSTLQSKMKKLGIRRLAN